MDQDIGRRTDAAVGEDGDGDTGREARLTRQVHVVLGLVVAALGAWLLYRSRTELDFRGSEQRARTWLPSHAADAVSDRPRAGSFSSLVVGSQSAQR